MRAGVELLGGRGDHGRGLRADAAQTPCTEIFGGPDIATIQGTLRGEPVEAELTRANGCEIERFDRFTPMLRELFPGYRPGSALAP